MLFSAISFVYYFLPIVLLVYFLVPKRFKNLVLLFSSLFFYFYGETVYILIMLTSSLSGYIHAIAIDKAKKANIKKAALISSIIVSAGLLCLFKYADFLIGNINALGFNVSLLKLPLPLGISFYTFQILSYIIDVYRMKTKAQYNIIDFTTYVTLFPQLIAGPIVRYITIEEQLKKRNHSFENIAYGIRRFIIGLSKKVLLANTLALFGQEFIVSEDKSVLFYWLYYILLALQIYFDFSGYSDMAIGLGRIFGFKLLENFNYPFISKSIAEFWRRWHISLFSWLRDYIYFPLGGNRVSKIKWLRNIFVVWFFTGLWHGAGWNFIMWGLFLATILILEKLVFSKVLEKFPPFISRAYFIIIILISFVMFDNENIADIIHSLTVMFGFSSLPFTSLETVYYFKSYLVLFSIAIIAATPIPKTIIEKLKHIKGFNNFINIFEIAYCLILLLIATAYLVDGSFNPFLYFRF